MKFYNITSSKQVYALNVETDCKSDNCPPEYMEYIVEKDGNYYITLNNIRQSQYEYPCVKGDIIQMWVSQTEVISDYKRPTKNLEDHVFIEIDESLSKIQTGILLLIHLIFIIGIPIALMSLVNNIWIELLMFGVWFSTLKYTSYWIQHNITNKIIKLIFNEK